MALPIDERLRRRFYEAVKFEETLVQACTQDPSSMGRAPVDIDFDIEHGAEQAFRSFVNKLAHVSDTHKAGATVTAVCVLQEFDGIHYLIGSNERALATQRARLAEFIEILFRRLDAYVKEVQSLPDLAVRSRELALGEVLHHIVGFNKPRIKFYIKGLRKKLEACIPKLQAFQTADEEAGK